MQDVVYTHQPQSAEGVAPARLRRAPSEMRLRSPLRTNRMSAVANVFLGLAAVSGYVMLTTLSDAARACAEGSPCSPALAPTGSAAIAFAASLAAALLADHLARRARSGGAHGKR